MKLALRHSRTLYIVGALVIGGGLVISSKIIGNGSPQIEQANKTIGNG